MLKAIDLEATSTRIYTRDPAIDDANSDPKAYFEEAYFTTPQDWGKYFKPLDGQQFTQFVIGVIPASTMARIEDDAQYSDPDADTKYSTLSWQCFLYGLRDIKNGPVGEIPDPRVAGKTRQGVPMVQRNGVEYVDPTWLNDTFHGPLHAAALEIGGAIFRWQRLCGDDTKNSSAP